MKPAAGRSLARSLWPRSLPTASTSTSAASKTANCSAARQEIPLPTSLRPGKSGKNSSSSTPPTSITHGPTQISMHSSEARTPTSSIGCAQSEPSLVQWAETPQCAHRQLKNFLTAPALLRPASAQKTQMQRSHWPASSPRIGVTRSWTPSGSNTAISAQAILEAKLPNHSSKPGSLNMGPLHPLADTTGKLSVG